MTIIQSDTFKEVFSHLCPETLIFCDLDNTLIEASQQYGSSQWWDELRKELTVLGKSLEEIEAIIHPRWLEMLNYIQMRLVDPEAPGLIQELKISGTPVWGLTARYPDEAFHTHQQLQDVGIEFSHDHPDQMLTDDLSISYGKGVIFCGMAKKKSEAILAFLRQHQLFPKKILFIEDRLSHLEDVGDSLAALSIEYVGVHFTKVNKRLEEYDPALAEIQGNLFPLFLSDEEARELLVKKQEFSTAEVK